MWEFILEKSLIIVACVTKLSHKLAAWIVIGLSIMEQNHMNVVNVVKFSRKRALLPYIWVLTLGKCHMYAAECGKGFLQKCKLVTHMNHHIGVRPYACNECDKTFQIIVLFIKHQRIHTGENPYSCSLCNKVFSIKSNLF